MTVTPIQNVWFDDAATSAMGEAFDRAYGLLRSSGSAVPEIIANLIIQAAKDGQRDAAHLFERVSMSFGGQKSELPQSVLRQCP
jgi:hypothetical protein